MSSSFRAIQVLLSPTPRITTSPTPASRSGTTTRAAIRPSSSAASRTRTPSAPSRSSPRRTRAQRAIDTKDAAAVLRFGQTFSADVEAGRPASVQLLLDTRRSNTALMIDGYASDIVATYAASLRPGGSGAARRRDAQLVQPDARQPLVRAAGARRGAAFPDGAAGLGALPRPRTGVSAPSSRCW